MYDSVWWFVILNGSTGERWWNFSLVHEEFCTSKAEEIIDIIVVAICVVDIYGATGMEFGTIKLITVPCIDGSSIGYAHVHSNCVC